MDQAIKIALTGAGGRLGFFIQHHLHSELGFRLRCLQRAPATPPVVCADAVHQVHTGDLASRDFRPFLQGCWGLVHAAFSHVDNKYRGGEGEDPEGFWDLNFISTVRLLEQAREVGVGKVVLFSSRAVYATDCDYGPGRVDETRATCPDTHYGALKAATETLARLYSDDVMQVTVLRPTGVYGGPVPVNKWTPLLRAAFNGDFPTVNRTATEVHGATVAHAAAMALQDCNNHMAGQVYNLSEVCVTTADILGMAGFDLSTMPAPKPLSGPELSSEKIRLLGLPLLDQSALRQSIEAVKNAL